VATCHPFIFIIAVKGHRGDPLPLRGKALLQKEECRAVKRDGNNPVYILHPVMHRYGFN
jgi:hypothetical protein